MSFDAFRLFAIGSKQTRNATTPEARRLRLEALEDRALLSVSDVPVFCGPPTYEAWQAQQNLLAETQTTSISSAVVSASANNSDDATLYLVSDVEDSQTDSAPLQDVYSQYLNEGFVNGDDLDEFIEVVGVTFLNGDSDNDDSDSDDSDDEGGTRDVIDWPISFVSCALHSASNTSVPGLQNVLRESYGVTGTQFDPVSFSGDYFSISLPMLPVNYMGVITIADLSPSSSISYLISGVTPAVSGSTSGTFYFGGGASGGAQTLYLVPINDAAPTTDKTLSFTMGQPICLAPSGGNDYNFIVDAQSVSATIVDDDHWNVTLTPDYEVLYDESGHIIPETLIEGSEITNGTFATFTLSRGGDGTFHSSDRSYPINVDISLIGQTDSSDFVLSYSSVLGITWTNTTSSSGIVTITIPANEVSVKFRVHAIDDSMVERYFESLTISISDAKNDSTGFSYIEYPFVFTERMLQVQDVGTLTLETVKFINVEDLKADPGQILPPNYFNWQTSTHWTKDQPGITLPVAYVSTNKIKTDAHFSGSIAQDIREQLKIRYRVIGIGAGGLSPSQTVAVSDDDISISNLECDSSIADFKNAQKIVLSVPQLTLEWQFAVGDETIYRVVQGQSQNPFYALFDHPTSDLYLTSVHTACVAANEETSETAVFDAIWAKFHSLSIRKAELMSGVVFETTLLSYYGKECEATSFYTKLEIENMIKEVELALQNGTIANYPSLARQYANSIDEIQSNICFSTEGLLRETDGTCGAWQDFMIDVLGTQKISASRRGIIVNPNTSGGYFKVYSNIDGQGAGTPKECIWRNHAVVEYGDNIYDPSYGKLYGPTSSNNNSINDALTEFVLHSVESIGVINAKNLNVSPLGYGWVYSVTVDGEDLTASDFLLL